MNPGFSLRNLMKMEVEKPLQTPSSTMVSPARSTATEPLSDSDASTNKKSDLKTSRVSNRGFPLMPKFLTKRGKRRPLKLRQRTLTPSMFTEVCYGEFHEESNSEDTATPPAVVSTRVPARKAPASSGFVSVTDRPFGLYKSIDRLLAMAFPQWSAVARRRIIHHLIHFLELKSVIMDESCSTSCGDDDMSSSSNVSSAAPILLWPTPVIDEAWQNLVMESSLYQQVVQHIQEFHAQPCSRRHSIPYSWMANRQITSAEREEKVQRTQALFQVYFDERMPEAVEDEQLAPVLELRVRAHSSDSMNSRSGLRGSPSSTRHRGTSSPPTIQTAKSFSHMTASTTASTRSTASPSQSMEQPYLVTPPYDNTPMIFMCAPLPSGSGEEEEEELFVEISNPEDETSVASESSVPLYGLGLL